jgi:histone deacetylase HOS3
MSFCLTSLINSENIHLQPYTTEDDFYERIYPKYLALLDKARTFMLETGAAPEKTIVLIRQAYASLSNGIRGD